jgi:triosephosphate isomerase
MTARRRRPVMAGNWKMFKTLAATKDFFEAFLPLVRETKDRDIVVAPPFTAISTAVEETVGSPVAIGGQDLYWGKEGAFTERFRPACWPKRVVAT